MTYDKVTYWRDLPDESLTFRHRRSWWRRLLGLPAKVERYRRRMSATDRYDEIWAAFGWRDDKDRPASASKLRDIRAELLRSRLVKGV